MPRYLWRCEACGIEIEVERPMKESHRPPAGYEAAHFKLDVNAPLCPGNALSEQWQRVITPFGIGKVEGAGGSPPRGSV